MVLTAVKSCFLQLSFHRMDFPWLWLSLNHFSLPSKQDHYSKELRTLYNYIKSPFWRKRIWKHTLFTNATLCLSYTRVVLSPYPYSSSFFLQLLIFFAIITSSFSPFQVCVYPCMCLSAASYLKFSCPERAKEHLLE